MKIRPTRNRNHNRKPEDVKLAEKPDVVEVVEEAQPVQPVEEVKEAQKEPKEEPKKDLVAIGAELRKKLSEKKATAVAGRKKRRKTVGRVSLTKDLIAVPPDAELKLTTLEGLGRPIDGVLKSQKISAALRKDEEALALLEQATLKKGTEVMLVGNLECWSYDYKGAKDDEPKQRSAKRFVVEVGGQLLAAYPDMLQILTEPEAPSSAHTA